MSAALDCETRDLLADSLLQDELVLDLRLAKARANLVATAPVLDAEETLTFEDRLLTTEFNIERRRRAADQPVPETVYPDASAGPLDELNMLASDMHLRRRGNKLSKLELDQLSQDQLSEDLLSMTASIKRNAQRFQEKLEEDADLVGVAHTRVQATSGSMASVGERLSKFRKQGSVGWIFYLLSTLFIVVAFVVGMSLIQAFGKW